MCLFISRCAVAKFKVRYGTSLIKIINNIVVWRNYEEVMMFPNSEQEQTSPFPKKTRCTRTLAYFTDRRLLISVLMKLLPTPRL